LDRLNVAPRHDWREKVEGLGLVWHSGGDTAYWDDAAYYRLRQSEIDKIESATRELYDLFLKAGDHVVRNRLFPTFGIPPWCESLIIDAWEAEPPALNFGRFDLGFDGSGQPKLFEFNCDTPTSLLEAALVQWQWKEEVFPAARQFNTLHDKLVAKWEDIAPALASPLVHFAHAREATGEDAVTTAYLLDTAMAAGLQGEAMLVNDIGWADGRFWDMENREIRTLFHLYPWEWLVNEPFGRCLIDSQDRTLWIEPIWKMMWSNKAILPILWELFPSHPNLLWAASDKPRAASYARKPALSREGANITLVRDGREIAASGGGYGGGAAIFQGLYELPDFGGHRPVIGSWIVDGEPAGVGIREGGPITGNGSGFRPHIIG
jgi:glutathionylspermidine synthase